MEYEFDRPSDTGGEPSLSEMTAKFVRDLEHEKQAAVNRAKMMPGAGSYSLVSPTK